MGRGAVLPGQPPRTRPPRRTRLKRNETARIAATLPAYAPTLRHRLAGFAHQSSRHTDLLSSFPAAAVAIVTGFGPAHFRGEALWQVRAGAPLAEVADALGLPVWMRRLPPDCFDGPLPLVPEGGLLQGLDDAAFGRRVVTSLPEEPRLRPAWLRLVMAARSLADDDFAAWVGREATPGASGDTLLALRLVALFAWASRHGDGRARAAIGRAWTPRISWLRAVEETARWYRRLIALSRRREDPETEACAADWRRTHRVGRYEIQPIVSAAALRGEALAMRNCLRQYEPEVLEGRALLFAIRAAGRSVATLELTPSMDHPSRLSIAQLKGVANAAPPRGVRYAVGKWMASRPPFPWRLLYEHAVESVDRRLWSESWRPYALDRESRGLAYWAPTTARSGLAALYEVDRIVADSRPQSG